MEYPFPFTDMDLEKRLDRTIESHREAFLFYLASEPFWATEPKESEGKGQEMPSDQR